MAEVIESKVSPEALKPLAVDDSGDYFFEYLTDAAGSIDWYWFQVSGDWQGDVDGIGVHGGRLVLYSDGYGSCALCGAWGEGGEPDSLDEVLRRSTLYSAEEVRQCLAAQADESLLRPFAEYPQDVIKQLLAQGLIAEA